ncbi:probable D-lactate dehydrogenase, mitochondrial isoform X2 [Argopecten irradians]|uniref:probable D-lactate dehydrogenase, mitochondrial isoform X2 n=1 Tax=Argopecten irradians TaxID=31199 RepID=UPI003712570E
MYCRTLLLSVCRQTQRLYHRSAVLNAHAQTATKAKIPDRFVQAVIDVVGDGNVSTTDAVREQHGHDESYHDTSPPDIVAFAESTEHVSQVAKLCNDHEVPLIPFGSGTGLEGGINALKGGLCLDLSKMNKIVSVNAEDFDCTVEAGVTRVTLNNYLRDTGLTFPIDPGADASVCGMCATSASGTNAVRYGTMRENVLNMEVVLPDGRIIHTAGKGRRTKKTSAGYNLTNLFVGSEGTLGIITQATLRLHGIPEATISAVCSFNTIQEAVDSTVQVLQMGIPIARIEFLDEVSVDACNKYSKLDMKVAPSLFFEFTGSPDTLDKQAEVVKDIVSMNGGSEFKWASDPEARNHLWKARHDILYACMALKPGSKPYSTDVCVPISSLPEVVVRSKEAIQKAGVIGPIVGHVGDGNFHVFFPTDRSNPEEVKKISDVSVYMAEIAMELDGTCTGEHGIGMGKRGLLQQEIGDTGMEVMKQLKATFDPKGIMNPGKVFFE